MWDFEKRNSDLRLPISECGMVKDERRRAQGANRSVN
jgi:hypothetical protein